MLPKRRKSYGSIRSPHVKRNWDSEVTWEDWLYRLEGGTPLRQWKQRWCVLTDFCLFFYKDPHEEQVMSSILLPSYKINPCCAEDRISRKYAFKAEHHNMKTYYFAVESKESMRNWMNAMSLATIMQKPHSQSSKHEHHEPLKYRSSSCGDRVGEMCLKNDDQYPTSFFSQLCQSSSFQLCHPVSATKQDGSGIVCTRQPLYANAPPKPRRQLIQTDNFGDCYDDREPNFMNSTQLNSIEENAENSQFPMKNNSNTEQYVSSNLNKSHLPTYHTYSAYSEEDSVMSSENFHNACFNPSQPHSADFLEKKNENHMNYYEYTTPVPQSFPENNNRQPERPKSSLEFYDSSNPMISYIDNCNFEDYYRDAVRIQADNFCTNKNFRRSRNFFYAANNSQRQTEVTAAEINKYCSFSKENSVHEQYHLRDRENTKSMDQQNNENANLIRPEFREPMQRLQMWKQQMLHSPLSRHSHMHSSSPDIICSNSPRTTIVYVNNSKKNFNSMPQSVLDNSNISPQHQNKKIYSADLNRSSECSDVAYSLTTDCSREIYEQSVGDIDYHNQDLYSIKHLEILNDCDASYSNQEKHNILKTSKESETNGQQNSNMQSVVINNVCYPNPTDFRVLGQASELYSTPYLSRDKFKKVSTSIEYPSRQKYVHSISIQSSNHKYSAFDTSAEYPEEYSVLDVSTEYPDSSTYNAHTCTEYLSRDDTSVNSNKNTLETSAFQPKNVSNSEMDAIFSDKNASLNSSDSSCHYPLPMLSFSTLPNVNAVRGADSVQLGIKKERKVNSRQVSADSDTWKETSSSKICSKTSSSIYSSYPDKITEEDMHLKKFVEQSHGLMWKGKKLSILSGDLLGKTQEELVLLLIQLRRNQSKIMKAKEKLHTRLKRENPFHEKNEPYEELCDQMVYLERLYEMTQPLLTLVDNMVKLGSLYGTGKANQQSFSLLIMKDMKALDKFERRLPEESDSRSSLLQYKEMLEYTLNGIHSKMTDVQYNNQPENLCKLHRQQEIIEKELTKVKRLLRIIEKKSQPNNVKLGTELSHLQSVLDELAHHRHEVNYTVEKLKKDSPFGSNNMAEVRESPTGVAGSAPLPSRKKYNCIYLETDLDTMVTQDLAVTYEKDADDIPLYANAEEMTMFGDEVMVTKNVEFITESSKSDPDSISFLLDINDADERMKRFYGILPREKPYEIRTVRIVKRQSERRHREKLTNNREEITNSYATTEGEGKEPDIYIPSDDYLEIEEDDGSSKKFSPKVRQPFSFELSSLSQQKNVVPSAHEHLVEITSASLAKQSNSPLKKSKRRHYTVTGYQYRLDPQFKHYFAANENPRSRDDVDMERCLRTANTPDIVRSTIKKNDIFDDERIDRELGFPQKIEIPERYVEMDPENLSAAERFHRSLKAENICKMLSETATVSYKDVESKSPEVFQKKLSEEKRKRAQLLSLNQAIAKEVVEKSKTVAGEKEKEQFGNRF